MCFSLSCRIHVCQFKSHGLLTSFLKTADEVLDQWDTQSKRAPRWHTILSQHFDAQDVGEILVVGTSAGACQRCSTRLLWCLSFGCHVCFSLSCRIHVHQFKSHGLLTNFLQTADEVLDQWDTVHEIKEGSTIQDSDFEDAYTVCAWEVCDHVFLKWYHEYATEDM